jgi:glycosyltransferase involved in cell wall biosynthesis
MAPIRVVVAGLLHDGLGIGEAGRSYAAALAAAGYDVAQHVVRLPGRPFPLGDPGPGGRLDLPEVGADTEADVVVLCLNPPELRLVRRTRLPLPAGRVNVGVWAWEVSTVPADWHDVEHRFGEVWTYSAHAAAALRPIAGVPVIPLPLAIRPLPPAAPPDTTPYFLALADGASTFLRKNPAGAIEAFTRAFRPNEGPRLVVKLWNGDVDPAARGRLDELARARPDVEVVDRWLPRADFATLLAGAGCLVSLHRAEGFGLPIFEALGLGVPVVATGGTGPGELVANDVAWVVRHAEAPVTAGAEPYPENALWTEPDLDHAATQLRAVWDLRPAAARRSAAGRTLVATRLSPAAVGERLRTRVDALLAGAPAAPRRPLPPPVTVVAAAVEPWPAVQPFLDTVLPEIRALGGELVLGAADDRVVPAGRRPCGVRVVVAGPRRTTSPFALRAAAFGVADGEVIVVTEDHCRPSPGWLSAYVDARAREGAAALFTGPVAPGDPEHPVNWANYLMIFGAFAPPLEALLAERCPTIANCAVAGAVAAARRAELAEPGYFERALVPELYRAGGCVRVPAAVVAHVQNFGPWRHLRLTFDDARCAGAATAAAIPTYRPRLAPGALRHEADEVLDLVGRVVAARPAFRDRYEQAAFWLRALALARAAGLAVGARYGAGRSAERVD